MSRNSQGASQSDLGSAFENADALHVGDPDVTDNQRHSPETQEGRSQTRRLRPRGGHFVRGQGASERAPGFAIGSSI